MNLFFLINICHSIKLLLIRHVHHLFLSIIHFCILHSRILCLIAIFGTRRFLEHVGEEAASGFLFSLFNWFLGFFWFHRFLLEASSEFLLCVVLSIWFRVTLRIQSLLLLPFPCILYFYRHRHTLLLHRHWHSLWFLFSIFMLLHILINWMEILIVVCLYAGLIVVVSCLGNLIHFPVPLLGIGLGESDITSSSDVRTLLDGIGTNDVEVCSSLQSVTIVGNWLLLSDDSDAFVSI